MLHLNSPRYLTLILAFVISFEEMLLCLFEITFYNNLASLVLFLKDVKTTVFLPLMPVSQRAGWTHGFRESFATLELDFSDSKVSLRCFGP